GSFLRSGAQRHDDFSFHPQHRRRRRNLPPHRHHPERQAHRLRRHGRAAQPGFRPRRREQRAGMTMSSVALLLSPLWLSWKNSFARGAGSWTRRLLLAALALGFWTGTYLVIRRVLRYFETVYDLGPALAYQLLLIILLTFLSLLLFSNLVAA